mmetsp:Transcript_45472/g.74943  ORF Transcript_45472/g.74943 Transcript_45472/m.74943 type:complete len:82 (-) Transcript_45472:105-350(-)
MQTLVCWNDDAATTRQFAAAHQCWAILGAVIIHRFFTYSMEWLYWFSISQKMFAVLPGSSISLIFRPDNEALLRLWAAWYD